LKRSDLRTNYVTNTGIANLEEADLVLLIGTNPRFEATLFNTRLRKSTINHELKVALLGEKVDLSYEYDHLGDSASVLEELLNGTHAYNRVHFLCYFYFEIIYLF
jgi:NADH dehydrogenase (ubiquinone) Fe-S protein 1